VWPNPVENKQKQTVVIYRDQSCMANVGTILAQFS